MYPASEITKTVNILYQKFGFQLFLYSPGMYNTVKYLITGNVTYKVSAYTQVACCIQFSLQVIYSK